MALVESAVVAAELVELTEVEQQELDQFEEAIEQGLETFWQVGISLMRIRDKRLYREAWNSFEVYCQERWGMSDSHANRLIGSAEVVQDIKNTPIGVLPQRESHVRPLVKLLPAQRQEVWRRVLDGGERVSAAVVEEVVKEVVPQFKKGDQVKVIRAAGDYEKNWLGQIGTVFVVQERNVNTVIQVHFPELASGQTVVFYPNELELVNLKPAKSGRLDNPHAHDEHYTPPVVIERVLAVFGEIDLDPCSNSHESPIVPARTHYTREDNGLTQKWAGKVYMNPPYSGKGGTTLKDWAEYLSKHIQEGDVTEAICLLPAYTDTAWWNVLQSWNPFTCFVKGRMTYANNDDCCRFPSAIVYIGSQLGSFYRAFNDFGIVSQCIHPGLFGDEGNE